MEFTVVKFFTYDIRSTVIEVERSSTGETRTRLPVRMFLVSDLLNQYNTLHHTNKKFKQYLENKQTQELLQNWPKYTGGRNSDPQCQSVKSTGLWNIDEVIKYVTFSKEFCGAHSGYIICEELLIACLMWADPQFAISVYTFLKECREKNNDFLKKEVRQLKVINKTLRT